MTPKMMIPPMRVPISMSLMRPIVRSSDQCHRLVSLDVFRGITVAGFIKKIRIPFWLLLPAWLAYIVDISLYISNLAGIQEGKDAIVEEGGIAALVELD
ncbi:heparan-alpha-glucosaminide N-acetyltransferase [Cucumis melo var. makuwa]|uniref:Heparan-alpha-glucosaminide N-acetyltransferase n=1 Tax=Cucumis melo var. makuwa TaxID=1194695 RepID=A0A5A7SLV2_CUCMM|nr:heparan-alpha-glucosaminide N-acetyltransferase [Cucumis melo var. makuwa]